MKKSKFIYASIILASINFVVRVIGFIYKIILSKLIGPEGIGLFSMVMPVLMIFLTITTAGIPIAISKLVSKENSLKNYNKVRKIYKTSIYLTLLISTFLSTILVLSSKYISFKLLDNEDVYYSVLFLAPALIIISLSSVIRGYYYGLKRVKTAGTAMIIEQITRIGFVLGFIYYIGSIDSKLGAFIAVCGISLGEIFGLLWLVFNNKVYNRKIKNTYSDKISVFNILTQISIIAVPITISRIINVSLQLSNAILIPQRLVVSGLSTNEALATYGRVVGMTMPFIFLPFIVTSALVINIIPNISEQLELKQYNLIKKDILIAIKITILISLPVSAVYLFFSKPIALFIYGDVIVGDFMRTIGVSTVFLALQNTLSGILQGLGKQVTATINFIIGMSFQIFCTYYLVGDPAFGINGFFLGFIVSSLIICSLNYRTLLNVINIKIDYINTLIKPLVSTIIMSITIVFSYNYFNKINMPNHFSTLIILSIGVLSYFSVLIIIKGIPLSLIKKYKN